MSSLKKKYWRGLGDAEQSGLKLGEMLEREFPEGASELPEGFSRRDFLRLMAASLALGGTAACTRQPLEHIVPYIRQPEEIVPGKPLYYATALTMNGFARGILVETHEGRPTKIEGNPQHPATLGGSDAFMQAELLTLYDPERSRAVIHNGQVATWEGLQGELALQIQKWKADGGTGLYLLTRPETSPTFLDQLRRLAAKFPRMRWSQYDPLQPCNSGVQYHFDKAQVVVSLDSDFLSCGPCSLAYSRQFANARRADPMNRLYVIEPSPTLTGSMADHRMVLNPDRIVKFAQELVSGKGGKEAMAILADLRRNAGKCLVIAGESLPKEVHEAVQALNAQLGNEGTTVERAVGGGNSGISGTAGTYGIGGEFRHLIEDLKSSKVQTLIIFGGNPAYDSPDDFSFAELMGTVPLSVRLGEYQDETSAFCKWHLPETHSLESWSDAAASDGTVTIMQPAIEPLFGAVSRHELLSVLLEEPPMRSYDIIRGYWQQQHKGADFEQFWRRSLHDGIVNLSKAAPAGGTIGDASGGNASLPQAGNGVPGGGKEKGLHLLIRPSLQVLDGRFSNNAWMQEFPDPITKLVWDNAVWVSPVTAGRLHLENGKVVTLKFKGRSVDAPIWIVPGQAEDCFTVNLGYGRTNSGSIGDGVGFNAYRLRTSDAMWGGEGLEIESPSSGSIFHKLVTTQHHWSMEGRGQVRVGTLEEMIRDPKEIVQTDEKPPDREETLYPGYSYPEQAWGMVIDLNTCIGCGACTIACQAENNIPVVGKAQVDLHREMHWIRVDRYYEGDPGNPDAFHQPVPCMHCENAPCELVCPVAATVHSTGGLNQMVYNRCIGTRYCSNNCPYKVRRFNFLEYDADAYERPETRKLMRNPNVTVRSRGVMEKCTFCIQRISAVRIEARKSDRPIRDGEIIPACAQACPADAIIFGDIADANSRVAKLKRSPLNYGLLAELNTRPRTTYLAKIRNPNPEYKFDKSDEQPG